LKEKGENYLKIKLKNGVKKLKFQAVRLRLSKPAGYNAGA